MNGKWNKKYIIEASGGTETSRLVFESNLQAILKNHSYVFKGKAFVVENKNETKKMPKM